MDISLDDLVHILGPTLVDRAERMPEEEFEKQKWDRLSDLLYTYEKLLHEPLFEARRSYLLGLDTALKILLVRHILSTSAKPV